MRGELPWHGVLEVVRHLLTGCRRCVAVTGRSWNLGDLPPGEAETLVAAGTSVLVVATREQLRAVADELSKNQAVLRDLAAVLPVEGGGLWENVVSHLILGVLQDRLDPAIRTLHMAAVYNPREVGSL
jgi:hypothetical protein